MITTPAGLKKVDRDEGSLIGRKEPFDWWESQLRWIRAGGSMPAALQNIRQK
jgi:hypothetical protein